MEKVIPTNYYTQKQWNLIKKEMDSHPTPNLVVDLAIVEESFNEIQKSFPFAKIYYAIKTYPNNEIIKHLVKLGSNFDIASIYELDQVLSCGATPDRLSFGNTCKKRADIRYAYEKGCRLFSSDSVEDVKNIAKYAPGSNVFFRILVEDSGNAAWPLTLKFGAENIIIEELILLSKELGLNPKGLAFHVGSQQEILSTWEKPIKTVAEIFKEVKEKYSIELELVNLGGGIPGHYLTKHPPISEYGSTIKGYLDKYFPNGWPKTILVEPGRGLAGNCATMATSVVLISQKHKNSDDRWLYIDAGIWNGLLDTLNEGIKYPIYSEAGGELSKKFIISNANCDSSDIIYRIFRNPLPENIKIEDKIYWFHCGAYTSCCCTVGFNGFPPVPTYVINSNEI